MARAREAIDSYEYLEPGLVDKTTDKIWEFIQAIRSIKKHPSFFVTSSFNFTVMKILIKEMTSKDAAAVNTLSKQLGYPLSLAQTLQNINLVLQSKDHTAFVAEYENTIVGWIGASQAIMIEVVPYCEINGLVIDENHRGMGIGKLLIDEVKLWAKDKGNNKIGLHCNITRTEAHKFYSHMGFTEIKQQKNFMIEI